MAQKLLPRYPERLTRAGKALTDRLEGAEKPIITPYEIFLQICLVYSQRSGLYLRKSEPDIEDYRRLRKNLQQSNILAHDSDYGKSAYRIIKIPDLPADEICCIVDPFCYISHMSAMQRYGLTDRRPDALHLSRPGHRIIRNMLEDKMQRDYQTHSLPLPSTPAIPLRLLTHPQRVRGRRIQLFQTVHPGSYVQLRSSSARISTIGQTFVDTLEEPALCGGMSHVLELWKEHAETYLNEIVETVDKCHSSIVKVRAGYILDEMLHKNDARIDKWIQYAQRGGSRLLDPTKHYAPTYSERWMISINV